jgi:hypothetical protein
MSRSLVVNRLYKNKFDAGSLCLKDQDDRFLVDCPICQLPIFEYRLDMFRLGCSVTHHGGRPTVASLRARRFLLCGLRDGKFYQKAVYITAGRTLNRSERAERRAVDAEPLVSCKGDKRKYRALLHCDEEFVVLEPPDLWRQRLPPSLPTLPNTLDYASLMQMSGPAFLGHY